ncbi:MULTISPECIES: hypothetical protein [unclassified Nostoc]|uniref:hypothetical protein n=1 Tax=unclassified Nostoc TaxID=2593658 RepID=UPI0026104CAB|nr:hypothetical protein [Nostoc sp. S13]MDF5740149.1 hypothetical protein [Nostoc sp. S13]
MKPEIYTSREGFKIRLTKVFQADPRQKYRKEVARYSTRGDVSFVGRKILDALRSRLGLSEMEATAIEDEMLAVVRQEFRQKLQQYERDFSEALQQKVALSEDDFNTLRQNLQQILGLRNEDTIPIEAQVKVRIEAYKQNLQYYEQALAKAMQREYPLSQAARDRLQKMQKVWKLTDQDRASLENRVTAEIEAYRHKLQEYERVFTIATQQQYPLSEAKRHELRQEQQNLSLKDEDIAPLEARIIAEIEAYLQKLQQYEQVFTKAIQQQYPLSATQRNQLRHQQQILGLKDENIVPIETRITAEIEAYLRKLQQYEQAFTRAIQQQYPLSTIQCNQLRQQQQILGLKDENISPTEARIIAEIEAYLQKLQQYEQALIQTIQHEYPFSEEIREELKRYQQVLELGNEEVVRIEEKVVKQKQTNKTQVQQSNTSQPSVMPSHSLHSSVLPTPIESEPVNFDTKTFLEEAKADEFPTQLLSTRVTQVIPEIKPVKTLILPLQWIVPLILVVLSGCLGIFVKLRSPSGLFPIFSNPIQTLNPTTEATPITRSLANLSPGWVIKTNKQISSVNKQSLPPGTFLEVIEKRSNLKPTSLDFSVSMRVCANKSTQTPANTNNPRVIPLVPLNSKPLPETVLLNFSQLKSFAVSVLQSDEPNPYRTVTQPPVIQPPDTSPT